MCGLCSRPHSLVSPVLYVSATPRYPTSEWGSFCSSSPGARRTPAWHSLENVLRGGTRAAGTLNGLIVILFGQPRFSTWRRARARGLAPCAAGLSTANVGHVRTISTAPTQNARKTDRQRGRTDAAGRGRFLRFLPTLQFEGTRPLFSQAHGDIGSVNKQMSHRRQTVTRRTRCTPAPSRGLSASFKL